MFLCYIIKLADPTFGGARCLLTTHLKTFESGLVSPESLQEPNYLWRAYRTNMKINLKTKNFGLTQAIKNYLEEKLNSLDKFLPPDESISANVELAKTTKHHQKGDIFKAEVNLNMPGRLIRAVAEQWDLRVAIDAAKDELQREIRGRKEKNLSLYKKGARIFKRLIRGE